MQAKITKRAVDALAAGETIADTEVRGFRVRRLDSGVTVYEYRYSTSGRRSYVNLGHHGSITPEQARRLAKKYAGEHAAGKDPAEQRQIAKRAAKSTVDAVLDEFLARYVRDKLRSAKEIERVFDRYVRPRLGRHSIYNLRRADIVGLLDKVEDANGPVQAEHVLRQLRKAFNWQAARDDRFNSPIVRGMSRIKPQERAGRRALEDDEIRDLWTALDELNGSVPACFAPFVKTLLLSSQRLRMVSCATWDEIAGSEWVIPASRNKGKLDHLVPLTAAVAALLGQPRTGFVFSSDKNGKRSFSGFSKAKAALDAKLAEIRKRERRRPMKKWKFHDLRRTARSLMSRAGVSSDHAERVLGHVIPGVRGVYDVHAYAIEKRAALERLAALVDRILHPDDKVIALPKRG